MGSIAEKIRNWYRGKYVPPPENVPGSGVLFVMTGHYEPSRFAKIVRALAKFWLKHWHVLLPIIVAAVVALFIHFDSNSNSASNPEQKENQQITSANHASSSK